MGLKSLCLLLLRGCILDVRFWRLKPIATGVFSFICDMNGLGIVSLLRQCWATVCDFDLTLRHHRYNVLCLSGAYGSEVRTEKLLVVNNLWVPVYSLICLDCLRWLFTAYIVSVSIRATEKTDDTSEYRRQTEKWDNLHRATASGVCHVTACLVKQHLAECSFFLLPYEWLTVTTMGYWWKGMNKSHE